MKLLFENWRKYLNEWTSSSGLEEKLAELFDKEPLQAYEITLGAADELDPEFVEAIKTIKETMQTFVKVAHGEMELGKKQIPVMYNSMLKAVKVVEKFSKVKSDPLGPLDFDPGEARELALFAAEYGSGHKMLQYQLTQEIAQELKERWD